VLLLEIDGGRERVRGLTSILSRPTDFPWQFCVTTFDLVAATPEAPIADNSGASAMGTCATLGCEDGGMECSRRLDIRPQ
jgi:hypothetical protein